jgi:hypothetical protein
MAVWIVRRGAAPYISFWTFIRLLDHLNKTAMPRQVDRKYVGKLLGDGIAPQIVIALKWLGLIEEDGQPTEDFRELVQTHTRKQALSRILLDRYDLVFAGVDLANCSPAELDEVFQEAFPGGEGTRQRSAAFLTLAAKSAGMPVDPRLTEQPRERRGGKPQAQKDGERARGAAVQNCDPQDGKAMRPQGGLTGEGMSGKVVTLRSGGTVALSYAADLFTLSRQDRDFLFNLIDQLTEYEQEDGGKQEQQIPF